MTFSHLLLRKITGATALAFSLAACGGSSTSEGPSPSTSFASIQSDGQALADILAREPYTDPTTLPTSGSATYNGFIAADVLDSAVLGDFELNADFRNNSIDGNASNFFDQDENRISGQLDISNGAIDRSADTNIEYTFAADMTGTLSASGDTVDIDGGLQGDFSGSNYEYVEGLVFGVAETEDNIFFIDGVFLGER